MQLSDRDIELIDGFLRKELMKSQLEEFNDRLNDQSFKDELTYREDLKVAANAIVREERKSILQDEEASIQDHNDNKPDTSFNKKWLWPLLIIAILLISYLGYKSAKDNPVDSPALFAEYFEPFPNVINPIEMGVEQEVAGPFQLYEQQLYQEAIDAFNQNNDLSESEKFYLGLSYLYIDETALARNIFSEINGNPSHRFHQASEWYLSGIFIKEKRISEALETLEKIRDEAGHPFAVKAEELLGLIN
ncbi:MAG: hypothetical protein HKN68_16300 [Saprospiraceae bacterium]|nr:hypothetical protein [Saprospiraceae bacterium]